MKANFKRLLRKGFVWAKYIGVVIIDRAVNYYNADMLAEFEPLV